MLFTKISSGILQSSYQYLSTSSNKYFLLMLTLLFSFEDEHHRFFILMFTLVTVVSFLSLDKCDEECYSSP
jgi:hypothetical protein